MSVKAKKAKKVKIIKLHDMGYRGCAEPSLGTVGTIDAECAQTQVYSLPYLKNNGLGHLIFIKFKATDLGYGCGSPIILGIPPDCFEEI